MMQVKVYNINAEECGKVTLSDEVFKTPYNEALIHEVIVAYLANQRQGTKSTLTRTEVRGHAKKPWAQKHTGHARQGSTKGPQWTGGGVVFAPKPRDFSKKVNAKAKKVAFKSALSKKLEQNEITVLDNISIEAKTKAMQNVLNNFKMDKSTVLVIDGANENVLRAANNIPTLSVVEVSLLNTYEVVANKNVIITESAIKKLEEACK
ncbi:MAG: 50S ribosomal protein L4 [Clostridiales bacterium]|nr:50S ribosomal protein L4 [Clostridiales bacterium]